MTTFTDSDFLRKQTTATIVAVAQFLVQEIEDTKAWFVSWEDGFKNNFEYHNDLSWGYLDDDINIYQLCLMEATKSLTPLFNQHPEHADTIAQFTVFLTQNKEYFKDYLQELGDNKRKGNLAKLFEQHENHACFTPERDKVQQKHRQEFYKIKISIIDLVRANPIEETEIVACLAEALQDFREDILEAVTAQAAILSPDTAVPVEETHIVSKDPLITPKDFSATLGSKRDENTKNKNSAQIAPPRMNN